MNESLEHLHWIEQYAAEVRKDILNGVKPTYRVIHRMADLAEMVRKEFDTQFEEWCDNAEARRGNGPQ